MTEKAHRVRILSGLLTGLFLFCFIGTLNWPGVVQAQPSLIYRVNLAANVVNRSPQLIKYLYSFPLRGQASFIGLSGNVTINAATGQGFAEALFSVYNIPAGQTCPKRGEHYLTYGNVHAHFPKFNRIASFIVKVAASPKKISIPTNFTFPVGIPVSGCLVAVLDGGGLQRGITFGMSSRMVALLSSNPPPKPAPQIVGLDEEFCFGTGRGCHRHTTETTPQAAWMHISRVKTPGVLLLLYGDIGDSTWREVPTAPIAMGPWKIENAYYLVRRCTFPAMPAQIRPDANGNTGPSDFFHGMPPDSTKLYDVVMNGVGQAALHTSVHKTFGKLPVHAGDCLVSLVRVLHPPGTPRRGIDAESQVYAEIDPN